MNKIPLCVLPKLLLMLLCFSQGDVRAESVNLYTPENIRRFADFLYDEGDYLRAAGEYQRYLFYQPQDSEHIQYKIAFCYRLGGESEQAIRAFEALLKNHPDSPLRNRAYYQIGASYFLLEQFEQSELFLHETMQHIVDVRYRSESEQLIGLSYLMRKKWPEASEVFKKLQESDLAEVRSKATLYLDYAEQGTRLPTRSPFLAGLFSTVLPGSGRLYTGRTGDAITSLLIVGVTGWQAYDGFRRDGIASVKGWSLGTIGGIFYLGNIYGSIISAQVYNREVENEFLTTLSIEFLY